MYFIVRCPNCNKLQIYKPLTKDTKKWVKRCVFCKYTFLVNPKSEHSSSIIIFYSPNIKEAQAFIKKYQNAI